MEKKEAIQFLRRSLGNIHRLARLHHANIEYPIWYNRVAAVLGETFGHDSPEYSSFTSSYSPGSFSTETSQALYRRILRKRYTDIQSIIRRYEVLGVEENVVTPAEPLTVKGQSDVDKVDDKVNHYLSQPDSAVILATIQSIIQRYFEVSVAGVKESAVMPAEPPSLSPRAFISHSKESPALDKLEEFLRALDVEPLTVKGQSGVDETVDDRVNHYLSQADFAVILATGDDEINGKPHPGKNVIHEIELAEKVHKGRIIYLLEEGVESPSNISPAVRESFTQNDMAKAFLCIVRELKALGILKVVKPETGGVR